MLTHDKIVDEMSSESRTDSLSYSLELLRLLASRFEDLHLNHEAGRR